MAELSTWEKKLTSDRDQLLADIATTERDLAREQDIAHGRLQAVPRGATALALVEETALEKLPRLEAKLGVQRRALSSIEFAITQAPPRVAAFQKTLAPLAHALTMRDEAMYEAEENFRELLAALLVLRKANTDATARLTTAMKAWGDAGHLATELPAFASTRWSAEIRGWLRNFRAENYSTPFITIELDDDLSGPLARAYPESLHRGRGDAAGSKGRGLHVSRDNWYSSAGARGAPPWDTRSGSASLRLSTSTIPGSRESFAARFTWLATT